MGKVGWGEGTVLRDIARTLKTVRFIENCSDGKNEKH